jgi:hypothetical protein
VKGMPSSTTTSRRVCIWFEQQLGAVGLLGDPTVSERALPSGIPVLFTSERVGVETTAPGRRRPCRDHAAFATLVFTFRCGALAPALP